MIFYKTNKYILLILLLLLLQMILILGKWSFTSEEDQSNIRFHPTLTVPQDFGYLPEKSLIRASIDFITEAGRKGNTLSNANI